MSYNYISGQSNVLTEPQAKSVLSSKLQSFSHNPPPLSDPHGFKPFTKPPACEFNFQTPNHFYPPQHTHSFNNTSSAAIKARINKCGPIGGSQRNVSFDEVFKNQSRSPQITITKQQCEPGSKHVSFDESVLGHSPTQNYVPKSPAPKIPPKTLPKPQAVLIESGAPGNVQSFPPHMQGRMNPSAQGMMNPGAQGMMNPGAQGMMNPGAQGTNQSFYQQSFQTITTSTQSSNNLGNSLPEPGLHQMQPSAPPPSTFKQQQSTYNQPGANLKPVYGNDPNVSPTPFGEPKRTSSPFRHVNAPMMMEPHQRQQAPPPPPHPHFGGNKAPVNLPTSMPPPFTPMEMNELSPFVKDTTTNLASSPGEPIYLENGKVIPSDTKVMVKDQNAWYRQMSKTIHGLKGDMPMNRVATWNRP